MLNLICDESGSKGRASNQETYRGEFGLIAGYLLQDTKTVPNDFVTATDPIYRNSKATHITDLPAEQQDALRQNVFTLLTDLKIPIVYEAIFVQGFYAANQRLVALQNALKKGRRSRIKLSIRPPNPRLLTELFEGILGKAVGTAEDLGWVTSPTCVMTDTLDAPLLKEALSALRDFASDAPIHEEVSGFDPDTNEVVHGETVVSLAKNMYSLGVPPDAITIDAQDNEFTKVADVVANSLYYHLQEYQKSASYRPLNDPAAIKGFPLAPLIRITAADFSNAIYSHPKAATP